MNRRIAASRIIVDSVTILTNAMVEIDSKGEVVCIVELNKLQIEPANTIFHNGLISVDVDKSRLTEGSSILDMIEDRLEVGYSSQLLLWKGVSLTDYIIGKNIVLEKI